MKVKDQRRAMVTGQLMPNNVQCDRLLDVMDTVPREAFVPAELKAFAYADTNLSLGEGRVLLAPMLMAQLASAAKIKRTDAVLDVGCGTGYSTAVLAGLAEVVVGLESQKDLAKQASENLEKNAVDNAVIVTGPLAAGAPKSAPFDVIFVNGAVDQLPATLVGQLSEGGRLVTVYMDDGVGYAYCLERVGDELVGHNLFNASAPILADFGKTQEFTF